MGYSHRWFREREIDVEVFQEMVRQFEVLLPTLRVMGVDIGDEHGEHQPVMNREMLWLNGRSRCGHDELPRFSNPWPDTLGGGVVLSRGVRRKTTFAGTTLSHRCCDGTCSAEPFKFPRVFEPLGWHALTPQNRYRQVCETRFRPYDIAVTAFLVIAKHHLGENITVKSDGNLHQWFDAKIICQMELGYGMNIALDVTTAV